MVGVSSPADGRAADARGVPGIVDAADTLLSYRGDVTLIVGWEGAAIASPPGGKLMDGGRVFFLKILPNIFLAPEGGIGLKREGSWTDVVALLGRFEFEETLAGVSGGMDGDPGVGGKMPSSLCENVLPFPPSILVRALADATIGASPHTSMGSRMARPIISKPRFWNLATLASVPASTTVLVMTLWACRL